MTTPPWDDLPADVHTAVHAEFGEIAVGGPAPYDLRHAAVSLWLNAGVHAPEATAERAGHGVDAMLRVYAKCIDGQREVANQRTMEVLAG
ncbi:hypothetical protein [Sphaerimonospora thailandensis]|uniref:Phage integrase family protein n=1 Tax=Sphaerimonospora thailandensis TaxID=795644 RepID=A0A8J3W2M9_9ACTN|nr:hypothetical protein Mth01_56510 [Sphaerimonospora thailandensis]